MMVIRSQNMPQTSNSLLSPTKSMVARPTAETNHGDPQRPPVETHGDHPQRPPVETHGDHISQSFALPPATKPVSHSFALPPATKPVSHLPCSLPPSHPWRPVETTHGDPQRPPAETTHGDHPQRPMETNFEDLWRLMETTLVSHLPCPLPPATKPVIHSFASPPATKPVSHLPCSLPPSHPWRPVETTCGDPQRPAETTCRDHPQRPMETNFEDLWRPPMETHGAHISQSFALPLPPNQSVIHLPHPLPLNQSVNCLAPCHQTTNGDHLQRPPTETCRDHPQRPVETTCRDNPWRPMETTHRDPWRPHLSVICLAPCHQTSQSFALPPTTKLTCTKVRHCLGYLHMGIYSNEDTMAHTRRLMVIS